MAENSAPQAPAENRDTLEGFLFALAAYLMWGFLPLYMKALAHVPAAEVVAHRALWSVPVAGVVLVALRRTADLKAALKSWAMIRMAMLTAGLISINWGVYVWAVGNGRTVETALGYYINPLFSVLLAATLLKERLSRAQWVAIAFAVTAVAILTIESGGLPWVSLALCVSWGFYAFFRKTLPIGPNQGFLLEVLILSPFALAYVVWLSLTGESHFGGDWHDMALLAGAGLVTAVPLISYANGAKRLRLSTIGIMQYIAPSMIFIIAVFYFREPFDMTRLVAFGFIWAALVIYSWSMASDARRARARLPNVEPGQKT
ncbi:protein RarD [Zhengella mangrovi]|uniref:Protein RarD n=1 Tax=Zhengella mangrovi TaxID=1982044 RepID=A0A2G1QS33_9HYPH|nr:EamA family transporter RarD [Zhengella mangrovi]PHP68270.1 protein RarD [Zhengella mangrovi]